MANYYTRVSWELIPKLNFTPTSFILQTMNCYHDLRANFCYDLKWAHRKFWLLGNVYHPHSSKQSLGISTSKKNWKCNRKTLSRQPEKTANHSPTCSLSLNYILNSTLYALGMNEGSDVTQQVSYVGLHITVTQNAREKNLLEHQHINRSCLTLVWHYNDCWIGDVLRTLTFRFPLHVRGHSRNQQKGGLNSHNITPRHSFLTIFLSLYSKRVEKLLQKWFNLLYFVQNLT